MLYLQSYLIASRGSFGLVCCYPRLTLLAAQVPVLSRSECAQQPGSSVPHRDQLCAGLSGSSHTACPGDSGGGLMARDQASGRWDLIGGVSTGGDLLPSQNIVP